MLGFGSGPAPFMGLTGVRTRLPADIGVEGVTGLPTGLSGLPTGLAGLSTGGAGLAGLSIGGSTSMAM